MRGKIGRICSGGGWVTRMTIRENILLAQLHHTRRSAREVEREAALLAAEAGLPGLPTGFPGDALPADLERAGWLRAFLGTPFLVLLEEPTASWPASSGEGLLNIMQHARQRGTAVLWMTLQDDLLNDATLPATRRYRLVGWRLAEVENP